MKTAGCKTGFKISQTNSILYSSMHTRSYSEMFRHLDEPHLFVIELLQIQQGVNPFLPHVLLCVWQNVRMNLENRAAM